MAALLDSVVVGRLSDCSASTNLFGNDCLDELIEEGFVGFESIILSLNQQVSPGFFDVQKFN